MGKFAKFEVEKIEKKSGKKSIAEKERKLSEVPNNMEWCMEFVLDILEFKDSFQFMSGSLENLVSHLEKSSFKYTKREFEVKN